MIHPQPTTVLLLLARPEERLSHKRQPTRVARFVSRAVPTQRSLTSTYGPQTSQRRTEDLGGARSPLRREAGAGVAAAAYRRDSGRI